MNNLNAIAKEVFQILRSYDYTVMMYDEEGMQVYEPEDARRLFAKPKNILVSINDDNENSSVNLYLSKSTKIQKVLGLVTSLRTVATKYNMIFNSSRNFKAELTPKDFSSKFSVREGATVRDQIGDYIAARVEARKLELADEKRKHDAQQANSTNPASSADQKAKEHMTDLTEGMYGTSRSSYLKLENARMIVRHSDRINEDSPGARSRQIDKIFVENSNGERFLLPTNQLAPARAMTQHFNHGGAVADEVGAQILRMATEFGDLGTCGSFISNNAEALSEGAVALREKCKGKRKEIRETFNRMFKESTYAETAAALREAAASPVLVEDAVVQNLREMLCVNGKELDESVLQTVARVIESAETVLDEAAREDIKPMVSVMGRAINAAVWKDFMDGHMDLVAPVAIDAEETPRFGNKAVEVAFKLRQIVPNVRDDTLLNFLAHIADELTSGSDPRKPFVVAKAALRAANVPMNEGIGFRGVDAIREHEAWFDSMLPSRILSESNYPDDFRGLPGGGDDELEYVMPDIMANFDAVELAQDLNPGADDLEVRAAIDRALRASIALTDIDLSIGADLVHYVEELVPSVMANLPLDEETFMPMLEPGEEMLSEDDFDDDGFDDDAAREIIAKLVQEGYSEGRAHNFSWVLKIAEEHRDSEAEMAYLARMIRDGYTEGHHPRWVLTITPMSTGGVFPGLSESARRSAGDHGRRVRINDPESASHGHRGYISRDDEEYPEVTFDKKIYDRVARRASYDRKYIVDENVDSAVKTYYTLAVREDGKWSPQYGSFDKSDVMAERQGERNRGVSAYDLRVVRSGESQEAVNAEIAKLNTISESEENLNEAGRVAKALMGAAALAAAGGVGLPIAKNAVDYHRSGVSQNHGSMADANAENAYQDAVKDYKAMNEEDLDENTLTREDILLPTDQAVDLAQEVSVEPTAPEDNMIAELRKLSGIK